MGIAPDAIRITDLIRGLLDRGYFQATEAVTQAIVGNSTGGVMQRRLQEVIDEAARLEAAGLALEMNNPVVVAFLSDYEAALKADGVLIRSASEVVQQVGIDAAEPLVRQLALPGMSDAMLAQLGITWNTPSPEAVNALVNFVGSPVFEAKITKFVEGTLAQAQNVIIRGMVEGIGPVAIARNLQNVIPGLSSSNAQQLMRTLQLTSFRESQRVHRVANAHILEYQIRIAALDDRTCMSCVALHGEILPIDDRIDDHHRGRCTSVTKIKGLPPPDVEAGESWFNRQNPVTQQNMMGQAAWDAWKAGAISLQDFPKPYEDDLFGRMIGENSLVGILGDGAQEFK